MVEARIIRTFPPTRYAVKVAIGRTEWEITLFRNDRKSPLELIAKFVEKYPAVGNIRNVTANTIRRTSPSQKLGMDLKNMDEKTIEESDLEFAFQPDCKPRNIPIRAERIVEAPTRKIVHGSLCSSINDTGVG